MFLKFFQLIFIITFVVVQQFAVSEATDNECYELKCPDKCPAGFKQSPSIKILAHLNADTFNRNSSNIHAREFYNSRDRRGAFDSDGFDNKLLNKCCPFICVCDPSACPVFECPAQQNLVRVKDFKPKLNTCCGTFECQFLCIAESGELVADGFEWTDKIDPCQLHQCLNGTIRTHISSCLGLHCAQEHRIRPDGECCDICDTKDSLFCPEHDHLNCDIACRYDYRKDPRGCYLCECTTKMMTAITSTPSLTGNNTISPIRGKQPETPTNNDRCLKDIQIYVIILALLILLTSVGALVWHYHRQKYNRIPMPNCCSIN